MTASVVLVHGAGAGSWTWRLVADGLGARDIDVHTPDLPSCTAPDNSVSMDDDIVHVRSVLDDVDGAVVLLGNSYGGYVISGAAVDRPHVRRLVYLSALMPKAGEGMFETAAAATVPSDEMGLRTLADGRIVFEPAADLASSFHLAPPEEVASIRSHLGRPMSLGPDPNLSLPRVAWETIPSTYVVCSEDRALRPEVQRQWANERATDFIEWPVDHSPQHSHPELVIGLLDRLARE